MKNKNLQSNVPVFDKESFNTIKSTIGNKLALLESTREELRLVNEAIHGTIYGDKDVAEVKNEMALVKNRLKVAVNRMRQTESCRSYELMKEGLNEEVRDLKGSLDEALLEFYRITGTLVFETRSGDTREFSMKAVLKRAHEKKVKAARIAKGQSSLFNDKDNG